MPSRVESFMVSQVKQLGLAVCLLVDLLYSILGIFPEFVFDIEDGHLGYAVQSSLDLDGSTGTACADDRDLLADDVDVIVLQGLHVTDTVSAVAFQDTVLVDNGVDCADKFCGGRQLVEVLSYNSLVGHGNVGADQLQSADTLDGIFQRTVVYFKCKICIVQAQICKCLIVHCGRT